MAQNNQYEVLNPWADVDLLQNKGLSPRVTDLSDKTIGLFCSFKNVSRDILTVTQERIKEKFPTAKFSWFVQEFALTHQEVMASGEKEKFVEWVKGIDTAITAVGD